MATIDEAALEFLSRRRIAVTGVSRQPHGHGSNAVYRRLRERGYRVFAVNPNASTVEGDPCFASLAAIPEPVEAVVIATRPEAAEATLRECTALGIDRVWMHRGCNGGSVSAAAAAWGRAQGIRVIEGGCPLMFGPASDIIHRAVRVFARLRGALPSDV